MTPERYQQIDQIFQAALGLEPNERVPYLDEACSGDEKLRQEVESLITSDREGLSFIDEPAFEMAARVLASDEPALAAGDYIDRYEVVSLLGSGGMGEVYLAHDEKLDRKIALKLLPSHFTANEERLRRFQFEARAASALNHPNIITIHEIGQVENQNFIATEFVDGETLRQRMKRAPLSLHESLDIAIQVCSALAAAHKAGIVHRDIKPENIMLRRDDYVKVLDFGLAKLTDQHEPSPDARVAQKVDVSSGLVMGTVKYMSPEQARGQSVDPRSDIFSLGVMLYEMVTGDAPFRGESAGELIKSILKDQPPRLTEHLPDGPQDLKPIMSKALAKDKSRRYQTAENLLVDLKAIRQRLEHGAARQTIVRRADAREISTGIFGRPTTPSVEFIVSQVRQHKTGATVGFLTLITVIVGASYPLMRLLTRRAAAFERTEVTRITSNGAVRGTAAISPDGKYIAYVLGRFGQRSAWIKELATNNDVQIIPATDGFFGFLIFTPDGKYLYYEFSEKLVSGWGPGLTALYRIPVSGGIGEKLIDALTTPIRFSRDGKQFAFIRQDVSQGLGTLVIANADGTAERSIATRKAPDYFPETVGGPSWSPDGKVIACVGVNAGETYSRVFEVNIETGEQRPLTSQKWDGGIPDVAWLSDSSNLLLVADHSIWRLSYASGELQRITPDTVNYVSLSLTADSSSLVTEQAEIASEIWIAPEADASRAKEMTPDKHAGDAGLAWTPDGRIVYGSAAGSNTDIWIIDADGTNQKQLTTNAHNNESPSVTPDGRHIVFQSDRTGADHIWRMDIDGGNQEQLTFGAVERNPSCSPDSKWVVYNAWESGKAAAWKVSIDGGRPTQITDGVCFCPAVSPDGNLIACSSGTIPLQRLILPFAGRKPIKTLDVPLGSDWTNWTLDGRATTYIDSQREGTNIWIQPIDGSPPQQVTNFALAQKAAGIALGPYAWSPDGKQLAFTSIDQIKDVVLIRDLR